ncbi:MAG: YigZ family protein, partial [Clostridiales bacterium]|nr:YigZ family protein [Clostridiales bacterium]
DVLLNHGLTNLVVVVTRYFGGTLLGTGGLVKAYHSATIEGLEQGIIITKTLGYKMEITTDYNFVGKIQYYIAQENIPTLSSEYTDIVQLTIIIAIGLRDELEKDIAEITNGQSVLEEGDTMYYALINNEIQVYPN